MNQNTHFIAYQHLEGGIACHALCFASPCEIIQHWEFLPQGNVLEAIEHAIDNYPAQSSIKVSDLSFLEPHIFESLYTKLEQSDDLFKIVNLTGIPLREWMSNHGNYLIQMEPCRAIVEEVEGHTKLIPTSINQKDIPLLPNQYWVEISHRGIKRITKDLMGHDDNVTPIENYKQA